MLVLQRKKGQSIVLEHDVSVTITILESSAEGVKISIDAPKEVKVLRKELVETVKANQESIVEKEKLNTIKDFLKKG